MSFIWAAASEGNAQFRNYLPSMSKKDKVADGTPRRALYVPFPLLWGRFLWGGEESFKVVWRTSSGVIGPISTSNDYLNTIFVKLVSLWGSFRNHALPRSHGKSFNVLQFSLFPYKKGIFCRSPRRIETLFTWIVRRAVKYSTEINWKLICFASFKKQKIKFTVITA